MLEETGTWQPPSGGSRPVPIGSRSIGVSLQPAIPRRVAPQQSPLPLHRSPTIVAHSRSSQPGNQMRCSTSLRGRTTGRARPAGYQQECHLYFARRVSFLSCADKLESKYLSWCSQLSWDQSRLRVRHAASVHPNAPNRHTVLPRDALQCRTSAIFASE